MEMTFNFNFQNKKGIAEILFGKGMFFSFTFIWVIFIFVVGFIAMPWTISLQDIVFRGIMLSLIILLIIQYYRAIIEVSFDKNNMFIKIMKTGKPYPIKDISFVKFTYYSTWGIVSMYIKGKNINSFYILWAPSFDRDRYNLFLNMKDYIEDKVMKTRAIPPAP